MRSSCDPRACGGTTISLTRRLVGSPGVGPTAMSSSLWSVLTLDYPVIAPKPSSRYPIQPSFARSCGNAGRRHRR
jgi:hypothetical protein